MRWGCMGSHKCSLLFCPNYVSNYVTIIPKYKLAENLKRGGSGSMRRKCRVGVKAPGPEPRQCVCVRLSVCLSVSLCLCSCLCVVHSTAMLSILAAMSGAEKQPHSASVPCDLLGLYHSPARPVPTCLILK